MEEKSVDNKQT